MKHYQKQINTKFNTAAVEGDVQRDNDARRIAKCIVPVVQIVTND